VRRAAVAGVLVSPAVFFVGFFAGVAVADRWNRVLVPRFM
jgi:hypothetical protein